jgi:hypothetical protein
VDICSTRAIARFAANAARMPNPIQRRYTKRITHASTLVINKTTGERKYKKSPPYPVVPKDALALNAGNIPQPYPRNHPKKPMAK